MRNQPRTFGYAAFPLCFPPLSSAPLRDLLRNILYLQTYGKRFYRYGFSLQGDY